MTLFKLECHGEVREVYYVEALDEADARAAFERGELTEPAISEASTEITSISEEE